MSSDPWVLAPSIQIVSWTEATLKDLVTMDVEFEATNTVELGKTYDYANSAHFAWLSEKGLGAVQCPQLDNAPGMWYQVKESVLAAIL